MDVRNTYCTHTRRDSPTLVHNHPVRNVLPNALALALWVPDLACEVGLPCGHHQLLVAHQRQRVHPRGGGVGGEGVVAMVALVALVLGFLRGDPRGDVSGERVVALGFLCVVVGNFFTTLHHGECSAGRFEGRDEASKQDTEDRGCI
jgi:hypothetical protein